MDSSNVITSVIFFITSLTFLLGGLAFGETDPKSLTELSMVFYNIAVGVGTLILALAAYKAGKDWILQKRYDQKYMLIDEARTAYEKYFTMAFEYSSAVDELELTKRNYFDQKDIREEKRKILAFNKDHERLVQYRQAENIEHLERKVSNLKTKKSHLLKNALLHQIKLQSLLSIDNIEKLNLDSATKIIQKDGKNAIVFDEDKLLKQNMDSDEAFIELYKDIDLTLQH